MDLGGKPDLAEQIAGALAWWREAGVDCDFKAEPQSWLATPDAIVPEAPTLAVSSAPQVAANPAPPAPRALPADLPGFVQWWLSDPGLDLADTAARIAPRGAGKAKLMVLVASPEPEDRDQLLSGPQGRLLSGILAALGLSSDEVYVASILPRHDALPDWPRLTEAGFGAIALHHISLVAPERVLAFGSNVSSLLAHGAACKPGFLPDVNHDPGNFPVLGEMELAAFIKRPGLKAGLWNRLLEWMGS
jgi:DNA polymerase